MTSILISSSFMSHITMSTEPASVNFMAFITIFHNTWRKRRGSPLTKSGILGSICVRNSNPGLISICATRSTESMEFLKDISIVLFVRTKSERLSESKMLPIFAERLDADSVMMLASSICSAFNPPSLRRLVADNMPWSGVRISCPMLARSWDLSSNTASFSTGSCLSIEGCSVIWCMTWMKLTRTFLL